MNRLLDTLCRLFVGPPEVISTNEAVRRTLAKAELRDGPLAPPRKTGGLENAGVPH